MASTLGEKLRNARKEKELTLDEISEELHIKTHYLAALESDNLSVIPSQTQARGFLRSYANHLGVSEVDVRPHESPDSTEQKGEPQLTVDEDSSAYIVPHQVIFTEIGETLRERRDILGLSLEDIEAHTRIPAHYVQYIESGSFDQFPSPAQSRGMLSNYLQFLDIGSEKIMARYAEALQASRSEVPSADDQAGQDSPPARINQPRIKIPQWVRMFLSPDLFLISTIGIIVVGLTIWGIGRITRTRAELSPLPTAPSLVEALLPTPTNTPTATITPETDLGGELLEQGGDQPITTPTPTFEITGNNIQLFLIVRQRAYLKVVVDGEVAFDGRTIPNTNLTFVGQDEIRVSTGNAAAIQVYYNDQDLGVLGIFGEVAEIFYTRGGIIIPTQPPTATASPTIEVTQTPELTSTPGGVDLPPEPNTPVP